MRSRDRAYFQWQCPQVLTNIIVSPASPCYRCLHQPTILCYARGSVQKHVFPVRSRSRRTAAGPASCPWQQAAGITLHDGLKLLGVERRLNQF